MSPVLVSLIDEKTFPLNRPSMFIGQDRWRVDIRLAGEGVEEVHCELIQHGTGFRLINLSDSGTLVNGQPTSEAVLHDGDELTIASHRLRLSCGASNAEARIDVQSDESAEEEWAALSQSELEPSGESDRATSGLWKIRLAGLELGPMPWDELYEMVQTGQAQRTDLVCRTDSSNWQPVSDVIDSGDNDSEASAPDQPPPASVATSSERAQGDSDDTTDSDGAVLNGDPQFFVMIDETESGPVPMATLQQLALEYRLTGVTLVREENETEWTPAGGLPIDIPPPVAVEEEDEKPSEAKSRPLVDLAPPSPAQQFLAKLTWPFLAPFYYLANALRAVLSLPPRTLAIASVTAVVLGSVFFFWFRGWSQTALTGTLTLDGEPIPAALITLTGMSTGDTAVGFTDSNGRFSARTLDGDLVPGRYHVTVGSVPGEAPDQNDDPNRLRVPTKYESLGTTDMIIEITPESSDYEVDLTARLSGFGFGETQ
jgi:hypothetical protein